MTNIMLFQLLSLEGVEWFFYAIGAFLVFMICTALASRMLYRVCKAIKKYRCKGADIEDNDGYSEEDITPADNISEAEEKTDEVNDKEKDGTSDDSTEKQQTPPKGDSLLETMKEKKEYVTAFARQYLFEIIHERGHRWNKTERGMLFDEAERLTPLAARYSYIAALLDEIENASSSADAEREEQTRKELMTFMSNFTWWNIKIWDNIMDSEKEQPKKDTPQKEEVEEDVDDYSKYNTEVFNNMGTNRPDVYIGSDDIPNVLQCVIKLTCQKRMEKKKMMPEDIRAWYRVDDNGCFDRAVTAERLAVKYFPQELSEIFADYQKGKMIPILINHQEPSLDDWKEGMEPVFQPLTTEELAQKHNVPFPYDKDLSQIWVTDNGVIIITGIAGRLRVIQTDESILYDGNTVTIGNETFYDKEAFNGLLWFFFGNEIEWLQRGYTPEPESNLVTVLGTAEKTQKVFANIKEYHYEDFLPLPEWEGLTIEGAEVSKSYPAKYKVWGRIKGNNICRELDEQTMALYLQRDENGCLKNLITAEQLLINELKKDEKLHRQVIKCYLQGIPVWRIEQHFGINSLFIRQLWNIPTRVIPSLSDAGVDAIKREYVRADYAQGLTLQELKAKYNIGYGVIYKILGSAVDKDEDIPEEAYE